MEINNCEQRSPEWFKLRELRISASHAQAIAANGKGLVSYVEKKMAEYYSTAERDSYTNKDMERGVELEDSAIMAYSFEKDIDVSSVGYVIYNDYVGVSPDGFANKDGLVEVKCPNDLNYFKLLQTGKIDTKYIWQMQMQMLVCGKDWCDFVAYSPNFDQQLFIKRVEPDQKAFEKLKIGFVEGEGMIKNIMERMEK